MANKKQIEQVRAKLVRGLMECEDRTADREVGVRLRRLREGIGSEPFSMNRAEAMLECIEELKPIVARGGKRVVEVCLSRLESLAGELYAKQEGQARMDMFSKLKSVFGKGKEKPQDDRLRSQEQDAEQKIFALEKKIAELSEERARLVAQFEEKAKKCVDLKPDSYDYKIARQQALILRPQIQGLEQQIHMHAKLLESNAKYRAMLAAGRTTFEIRSYMPDPAESDMLMKMVADETQEVVGDTDAFGSNVDEYANLINNTIVQDAFQQDDEFDRLVVSAREDREADAVRRAEEEKAAEAFRREEQARLNEEARKLEEARKAAFEAQKAAFEAQLAAEEAAAHKQNEEEELA